MVYQWTPATTGMATLETCGTGTAFDTVLYVRTGPCSDGQTVACNDDACPNATNNNLASRVSLSVIAGQTYFVIVDGYDRTHGNFRLTVTPPHTSTTVLYSMGCPGSAPIGTDIVVPVSAALGAFSLGAYALTINYNPAILQVTAIQGASTGVFTGAPTTNNTDWSSGASRFNSFQTATMTGPNGTVPLARITFHVLGGSGGAPTITLTARSTFDTGSLPLTATTQGCP